MTGYFFHCQHKCRTHGKKELSTNRWGMKAHIVHTMLTLLLMSSSSAFCVFGLACISTTATTIHFFALQFIFFSFSSIRAFTKQLVGVAYFFMLIIPFSYIFFALVVYILSCEPSRAIFLYHSFFRAFFLQNMKTVFRYSIYIFFCSTFRMLYTGVASDSHCSVLRLLFMFMWLFSVFHFTFTLFRCRNFVCCFHWWCVLVSFTHYSFLLSVCSTIRFAVVP